MYSKQSFSQILLSLPQFIKETLIKPLALARLGNSYHSYDRFIPFASQNKFLLSLKGT